MLHFVIVRDLTNKIGMLSRLKSIFPNVVKYGLVLVLALAFSFSVRTIWAVWTPPADVPPNCETNPASPLYHPGCLAPINVGSISQTKIGPLEIGPNIHMQSDVSMDLGGISGLRGTRFDWDTDQAFFGMQDLALNRKDAVILWGDDPEERLRFIHRHFITGLTEVMTLTGSGNVGIGTTSPGAGLKLDVRGYTGVFNSASSWLYLAAPDILFDSGSNFNIGTRPTYDSGAWSSRFHIQGSTGNVGIGVTDPGFDLDIASSLRLRPSSVPTAISGAMYYEPAPVDRFRCNEAGVWGDCSDTLWSVASSNLFPDDLTLDVGIGTAIPGFKIDVQGPGVFGWVTQFENTDWGTGIHLGGRSGVGIIGTIGPTNMSINPDGGRVGIGTTSPPSRLTVAGGGTGIAQIGTQGCGGNYVSLTLGQTAAPGGCSNYNILSSPTDQNLFLNRPSGYNIFFRENNSTQMTIEPGGNVGIGTTSPNRKLDVVGQILAKTNNALDDWIEFWPHDSAIIAKSNNPIRFGHATTPDAAGWVENMRIQTDGRMRLQGSIAGMWIEAGANDWFVGRTGGNLRFYNAGDRMTITPAGRVGIAQGNPGFRLDVNGQMRATRYNDNVSGWYVDSDVTSRMNNIDANGLRTRNALNCTGGQTLDTVNGWLVCGTDGQGGGLNVGDLYTFGGMFVFSPTACVNTNPFTGACSCPGGYTLRYAVTGGPYGFNINNHDLYYCY